MSGRQDSAAALVEMIERRAPRILDLLTAKTADEFDKALEVQLERSIMGMEQNSDKFASLDEDALSSILALALSVPGLSVSREANSNGHVDLTIELDESTPVQRRLGEAKIYDGPAYHISGLEQLLKRYTTGREGRGFVVTYVKKDGIANLVKKIRERMDSDKPVSQVDVTSDHLLKWSFISRHAHSCGDELSVMHLACNLYSSKVASNAGTDTDGN